MPGSGMANPALSSIPAETRISSDPLGRVEDTQIFSNGAALDEGHVHTTYYGTSYMTNPPGLEQATRTELDPYGRVSKVSATFTTPTDRG
jgi:hypothetical protein